MILFGMNTVIGILEVAKNNMNDSTRNNLIFSIIRIIKLCHPIIPFITEDIWRELLNKEVCLRTDADKQ